MNYSFKSIQSPIVLRQKGRLSLFLRHCIGIMFLCAVATIYMPQAQAGSSCNEDVAKFGAKRNTISEELNKLSNHGKEKMDPVVVCPKFTRLAAVEKEMLNYLVTNKDWCLVPDEAIKSMRENQAKSASYASRACEAAKEAKKAQEQAAQGIGGLPNLQKLPEGPL